MDAFVAGISLKLIWQPELQQEALDADGRGSYACFYNLVAQKLLCTKKIAIVKPPEYNDIITI